MTTKAEILRAIMENCIDCIGHAIDNINVMEDCGGQHYCKLYPFRFGEDHKPAKAGKAKKKQ